MSFLWRRRAPDAPSPDPEAEPQPAPLEATVQPPAEPPGLAQAEAGEQGVAAVQQTLAALERQVSRAGREQLKANALVEAQMGELSAALEALRTADVRREAELEAARERARTAQAAARLDVARAVLPALDGLDEAMRSGRRLIEEARVPASPRGLLARLRRDRKRQLPAEAARTLEAWIEGLTFVRRRLLDVLAAEGIEPIEAEGLPFDPERHIVVEVVPARRGLPPGTVAAEVRRGYATPDRMLRHAEVAVSRPRETT